MSVLRANDYPTSLIRKTSTNLLSIPSEEEKESPAATVVLPYVRNISESIRRILTPLNIRTSFTPCKTLRNILVSAKDCTPPAKKKGIVYEIQCASCKESYIGQTGRTLEHRLKEHQRSLSTTELVYNTSAVAVHALKTGHCIDWNNAKVIDSSRDLYPRCYLESWHIKSRGSSLNRDEGLLPPAYDSLAQLPSHASSQ